MFVFVTFFFFAFENKIATYCSAAEKNGEFLVPLSADRNAALRQSVKIHRDQLDNNFLVSDKTDISGVLFVVLCFVFGVWCFVFCVCGFMFVFCVCG